MAECPEWLLISGGETVQALGSKMGIYQKVAGLARAGRPVYERWGALPLFYIFFWPNNEEWRIGDNYTISSGNLKVATTANCPDLVTGWPSNVTATATTRPTLSPTAPPTKAPTNLPNGTAYPDNPYPYTDNPYPYTDNPYPYSD